MCWKKNGICVQSLRVVWLMWMTVMLVICVVDDGDDGEYVLVCGDENALLDICEVSDISGIFVFFDKNCF